VIDFDRKEILDVCQAAGTVHDYRIFKESLSDILPKHIIALMDSAYQGVHDYLPFALIPFKSSKNNPLTDDMKAFNTALAKCRIAIEHVNREIKIFKICKETYRGKGERGLKRVKLIASFYNHRCVS